MTNKNSKKRNNKNMKSEKKTDLQETMILLNQEKLVEVIVKAHQIVENERKEKEIEVDRKKTQEWREIIGYKEYPEDEKWYLKKLHAIRNDVMVMKNFLFFKAKNVRDMRATLALMQLSVMAIFDICKWFLYMIVIALIVSVFQGGIESIFNLGIAFGVWVFARAFRIASFEVEKMDDGNVLIAIFSGCISFVAVVVAIIAIFI